MPAGLGFMVQAILGMMGSLTFGVFLENLEIWLQSDWWYTLYTTIARSVTPLKPSAFVSMTKESCI